MLSGVDSERTWLRYDENFRMFICDVWPGYDGRKLLFAWRHVPEAATNHLERIKHVYHLFEMNADGSGVRQITDGPDDDFDPCYLPRTGATTAK